MPQPCDYVRCTNECSYAVRIVVLRLWPFTRNISEPRAQMMIERVNSRFAQLGYGFAGINIGRRAIVCEDIGLDFT